MNSLSIYRDGRNAPARKLKKGKFGKHIVHFPSIKNKETVVCESELESDFCLLLEYESSVVEYRPQPASYRFTFNHKTITYTPDFLAIYDTGEQIYYEVKPDHILEDEEYMKKSHAFSESLKNTKYGYKLVRECEIRIHPVVENLKNLYSRIAGITKHEQDHLLDTLSCMTDVTSILNLTSLDNPPSYRSIANAIFFKQVVFDIYTPINPHSTISMRSS